MADTINNGIPLVPENTIDPAAGLNLALLVIDRLLQLKVLDMKLNTPPASPVAGSRYIVGTAPTGAWVGENMQVAEWMPDGYWQFSPASVAVFGTSIWLNTGTDWVPSSAGGGTAWGGITGTLADQVDLASALGGKANAGDLMQGAFRDVLGASGLLYSQSGVVGTVSQSGGVPTGAIIEQGSNANGWYVRFAGGLQICISPDLEVSGYAAVGNIFRSDGAAWTHPAVFAEFPVVSVVDNINSWTWGKGAALSNSQSVIVGLSAVAETGPRQIVATAIGRWHL